MLGWKKQANLLPPTLKSNLDHENPWISTDSIIQIATTFLDNTGNADCTIDRLDYRVSKGIVKVLYSNCFLELQIDGKSGKVLSQNRRTSDFIERLHDGSIIDYLFSDKNQIFKLLYTTWVSVSLIILSVSGFFLWYNPGRIRRLKKSDI